MKPLYPAVSASLLVLGLISGCVSAADRSAPDGAIPRLSPNESSQLSAEDWMSLRLRNSVRGGKPVETVRSQTIRQFWLADLDGGGVSESDYVLKEQIALAQARTGLVSRWLKLDLDGDGEVTRAEVEASFSGPARKPLRSAGKELMPTPEQIAQVRDKLVGDALKQDRDGDDVITFAEAMASAHDATAQRKGRSRNKSQEIPLSLDRNDDGIVSETEYSQVLDRVLGTIDSDSDGAFSAQEIAVHAERIKVLQKIANEERRARALEKKNRALAESCGFPQAPKDATLVLIGGYEGQALSNVALGGDESVVTVANAHIEAGQKPLIVVLTSHAAMIWRFSGAVDRVSQVVATSTRRDSGGAPRVGIVGLPKERVFVPERADCMSYFTEKEDRNREKAAKAAAALVGRVADIVSGSYAMNTVKLPSGEIIESAPYNGAIKLTDTGPSAPIWQEMLRFHSGGLVDIDAEAVVSRLPAKRYETLPQQAGLAQLVESGAMRVVGESKHVMVGHTRIIVGDGDDVVVAPKGIQPQVFMVPSRYMILKKIRLPAGLSGAHSAKFILAPGVPQPDGSAGHSVITK